MYPQVKYALNERSITVHPPDPNGFSVSLYLLGPRYTVHFDGWHEEYDSEDDALNCVAFARAPAGSKSTAAVRGHIGGPWRLSPRAFGAKKAPSGCSCSRSGGAVRSCIFRIG